MMLFRQLNSSAMILILFLPFFILSIKTRIKCRTCKTTRSVSKMNVNRGRFEAPTRSRVKALFTSCGEHTFIFSYTGFWIWTATCGHLHATKIKIKKWGGVHIHFPYMRALVLLLNLCFLFFILEQHKVTMMSGKIQLRLITILY